MSSPPLPQQLLCLLVRYEQPLALLGLSYLGTRLLHLLLCLPWGRRYRICCGQWALVTLEPGTLSYCYAKELARRHMNIALMGEDPEELKKFAEELQDSHAVEARVIVVNLDADPEDLLGCLAREIAALPTIGVLVNQLPAPPAPGPHEFLSDCDLSRQMRALLLTLHLTQLVARRMAVCGGAIVNISDPSGEYPHAWRAAHSAACAYMDMFSRALAWELGRRNIRVQSLVASISAPHASCRLTSVPPCLLAQRAVRRIGPGRTRGSWWLGLRGYLASWLPLCLRMYWTYVSDAPPRCHKLEK